MCAGLGALILLHQILSLLKMRNPSEIWAYLRCPDGSSVPLTHWENLIGRGRGCDIILNLSSVSRSHATLIRDPNGTWRYHDLNSKNGSYINGVRVYQPTVLKGGDQLTIGGEDFELYPVSLQERLANVEKRKRRTHPVSPWPSLVMLTIFQFLTVLQFHISLGKDFSAQVIVAFALLCALMWFYVILMRAFRRNSFEMEIICFFLSTLSLAITLSYSYTSDGVLKQAICVVLGVAVFFFLCWYLRDLNRTKKITYLLLGISGFLLLINVLFGTVTNGAQNWIYIGGYSFQPSELVKIVFIYVGAATLDELQQKRSLYLFMGFSVFCLGCLALMGDFGTAIIFFVTFLVISFLRSGDFTKLILILGAAGLMGLMVLRFRPYVASRFETWRHAWDYATEGGYQQVQTMTATASGGLPGLGAGEGNLGNLFGAGTDLVFGMLAEEWGLIIAVLAVLCIITLTIFAFRSIAAGRSTYYSIAACSTSTLFVFQTMLNVLGSVDILPLTGVTFPFLSSGGTSMIASWGLLAFLKAADTRQNASFAIRLDRKSEFKDHLADGDFLDPEDIFSAVDGMEGNSALSISEQMDNDPEFQKYWEEKQRLAQAQPRNTRPAAKYQTQVPRGKKGKKDAEAQNAPAPQPKKQKQQKQKQAQPKQQPQPSAPQTPREDRQARPEPAPKRKASAKPRPRPVSYKNVDDDAFFRSLDEKGGRPASGPTIHMYDDAEGDQPVTLEDLFGGDNK
ncbi:MAG: FtsW/RodA/SpoVE family cell cycle protein [Firmicutes bacterium]|nr:FtsW/RodA/SpoVE family cell cycle protein [Bacillota bacterium]